MAGSELAPANQEPPKRLAVGNFATGQFAFGNIVLGVVSVGNVARGFIAIGNVAVGFVAIGNVAVGVFAFGATNAVGLVAGSFINTVPALVALGGMNVVPIVPFGFFALAVLVGISFLRPGKRADVSGPAVEPIARLLSGAAERGFVRAHIDDASTTTLKAHVRGRELAVEASEELRANVAELAAQGEVLLYLEGSLKAEAAGRGYREAFPSERVLTATLAQRAPATPAVWSSSAMLEWWISRGFRAAAAGGALAWIVRCIVT